MRSLRGLQGKPEFLAHLKEFLDRLCERQGLLSSGDQKRPGLKKGYTGLTVYLGSVEHTGGSPLEESARDCLRQMTMMPTNNCRIQPLDPQIVKRVSEFPLETGTDLLVSFKRDDLSPQVQIRPFDIL